MINGNSSARAGPSDSDPPDVTSSPTPTTALPTVEESFRRLHAAGWSVGEQRVLAVKGLAWQVTGVRGRHTLAASGPTQAAAWHNAWLQAQALQARGDGGVGIWRTLWRLLALVACIGAALVGAFLCAGVTEMPRDLSRAVWGLLLLFGGMGGMAGLLTNALRQLRQTQTGGSAPHGPLAIPPSAPDSGEGTNPPSAG